jgi:hypothetical protein
MTQLTQEYLDKSLKNLPTKQDVAQIVDEKIKHLPTKQDVAAIVDDKIKHLPTKQDVKDIVDEAVSDGVESLAQMVNKGFENVDQRFNELEKKLDVRVRCTGTSYYTGTGHDPNQRRFAYQ